VPLKWLSYKYPTELLVLFVSDHVQHRRRSGSWDRKNRVIFHWQFRQTLNLEPISQTVPRATHAAVTSLSLQLCNGADPPRQYRQSVYGNGSTRRIREQVGLGGTCCQSGAPLVGKPILGPRVAPRLVTVCNRIGSNPMLSPKAVANRGLAMHDPLSTVCIIAFLRLLNQVVRTIRP
jgi:hypothetical protein